MRRPKTASPDDAIAAALQEAIRTAAEPAVSAPPVERRTGALAQALRSLRPAAPSLTPDDVLAAVRGHDPRQDAAWADLAQKWQGLAFYAFDLEPRSLASAGDGTFHLRGEMLVSVPVETFGHPAPLSLRMPVRITVAATPGAATVTWRLLGAPPP